MALSQPTSTTSTSISTSSSQSQLAHISADHLTASPRPVSVSLSAASPSPASKNLISSTVRAVPALAEPPPASPSQNSQDNHDKRGNSYRNRQSTFSTTSSKHSRGGIFNFAALARDKTNSAIASLSEPSLRSRPSSGSLYRSAQSSSGPEALNNTDGAKSAESRGSIRNNTNSPRARSTPPQRHTRTDTVGSTVSLLETDPPSQAYSNTASDTKPPITFVPQTTYNKMHQTSSRLLRMTSDERPFTRVRWTRKSSDELYRANDVGRTSRICSRPWL